MPYVQRNPGGQIESLHRLPQPQARELLDEKDPALQAFLGSRDERLEDFQALDVDFVRVIEDLIDTLIVKNIVNITDLPSQAQVKLLARQSFRERVSRNSLRLLEGSEEAGESVQ